MRITFVLPGYARAPIGGFRAVYGYSNYLAERGHIVNIVHPYRVDRAPTLRRALKTRAWRVVRHLSDHPLVPWTRFHRNSRPLLTYDLRSQFIPDADVIFATAWDTAEYVLTYPATKGAKLYLVQHYETWAGPKERVDATWLSPLYKAVISRWLLELGESMGASRLRHICYAVEEYFRVKNMPASRPVSIVSLYHRMDWKGVADALEVLGRVHARYPSVPITMFGVYPRGSDIPDWVRYYQDPDQKTLAEIIYNGHAIYLGASWTEGFGLPAAEAMACGCVFVGTDSGGCRDYAIHERTALLSPARDRDTLYANLCRVIDDPELRRGLQERGTAYVARFNWQRAGADLEQYIQAIVQKRRPSSWPARNKMDNRVGGLDAR
jgi:glycosyltransferase involved in cell wall biosynthesis